MASIGQSVVGEAPCISLVEVAAEQMLEAIYIVRDSSNLRLERLSPSRTCFILLRNELLSKLSNRAV
jgi:hypothetical protein